MTKISATIVADSKAPSGDRLTTMLVTFPRFILAELNTHRMLSKNSASSRAIPFNTMVKSVQDNPFIPIAWQKEHKGMQGNEYLEGVGADQAETEWFRAVKSAIYEAKILHGNGVTKQLANRLLEPFMWHTVLVTGTEWENFFALRCPQYELETPITKTKKVYRSKKNVINSRHEYWDLDGKHNFDKYTNLDWLKLNKGQAEIHMMALAEAVWDAMNESTPKELNAGQWHIPFEDKICEYNITFNNEEVIKISTAMAARTSYTIVGDEKEFGYEKQIELHDRMANQVPFHASPFEHCARIMTDYEYQYNIKGNLGDTDNNEGWCRNYRGFIQYREILENKQ